jgi:hypothetical protein
MREGMQQKQQIVVWEARQWASMEYLRLEQRADENVADGTIIMVADNQPSRIRYTIRYDAGWVARQVSVRAEGATGATRRLSSDGAGHWTRTPGHPLTALDGCIDVDIAATPFTNTLPIRRLALTPGQSAEIKVAYINIPALSLSPAMQRYTCLGARPEGGRYRYENVASGFTAELTVDADGLVIDYAELWKRLWPR